MRADILQGNNSELIRTYLNKKFKVFDSWTYSKDRRNQKCVNYYLCASDANKHLVEAAYFATFHARFPHELAQQAQRKLDRQAAGPIMMERSEWMGKQEKRQGSAQQLLDQLILWKEDGDYQLGERFFNQLQSRVKEFDSSLVNPSEFLSEVEVKRVAKLTGSTTKSAREVKAEFEGMIGVKQSAKVSFEAYSPKWGEINLALKEDFKAGAWASGSARAALERKGFDLQAQAAVGFGAELNIDGSCTWKLANHGLDFSGNCNLFAGATASASGQLSVDLYKGINASIALNGFVGLQASVSGRCALTYEDKTMVGVDATASVQFGVGGSLSGSLQVPIFGATQIGFSTSASIGLGFGVSTNTEIHFSQIYLAGQNDFRKLIYLPTIAKGYRMDLMTQQAKNLHYLDKCIARIGDGVTDTEEKLTSMKNVPEDQQSLLIKVDRMEDDDF
jgi:hypothetical protein